MNRQERRRRERERAKEGRKKKRDEGIATRKLKVFEGGAKKKGTSEVRDSGKATDGEHVAETVATPQQLIDAIDVTYDCTVSYMCPRGSGGCGTALGIAEENLVASAFNRATFLMGCPRCKKVLRMRPREKKLGAKRGMQDKALKIAKARSRNRSGLVDVQGRPL